MPFKQIRNHWKALMNILRLSSILAITSLLFLAMYKVLPDGEVRGKGAVAESVFTAVIFMIGKLLINEYISNSSFSVASGAAASIIILLA